MNERPDEDVDAAFLRIIAGWDDAPTYRAPPATALDPLPEPTPPPDPSREPDPTPDSPDPGPRDYALAEEPDEGYVPPEPPPLPRGDVASVLSWAAVVLGPLFLFIAGLFWRDASRLWLVLAVVAFVGGFVALVMRLPARRDTDSDDDGAVV